jgi:hypothetical protein
MPTKKLFRVLRWTTEDASSVTYIGTFAVEEGNNAGQQAIVQAVYADSGHYMGGKHKKVHYEAHYVPNATVKEIESHLVHYIDGINPPKLHVTNLFRTRKLTAEDRRYIQEAFEDSELDSSEG